MKLLFVTPAYAPRFEGGTERVARAHAAALAELGHEVRVLAGTDEPHCGRDLEEAEVDGATVHFAPRLGDEGYDVELVRPRLDALARAEAADVDLVHVHHWSGFSQRLVRALEGTPVVVTFHDLFATCPRFFRAPAVEGVRCPERGDVAPCLVCLAPDLPPDRTREATAAALVDRATAFEAEARAAAALVAPSATHARAAEALLGLDAGAVEVVPHGLALAVRRSGEPERADWDGTPPLRVLHPGHRTTAKGTLDLVHALATLEPGAVELHTAGAEVEPGFDAACERAAADRFPIVRHGSYAGPDGLARAARAAHLVCLPSRAAESYGLVLDEALALGLPAWVSDRGALHERVGSAGRVLPAENPQAWGAALRAVLHNPRSLAAERAAIPAVLPTAADAARALDALYRRALQP